MRDHDSDVEFLNSLGEQPPTPEIRERVVAVLRSESEDLTRLAAKVLARWGDRTSVEALRDLLTASESIERMYVERAAEVLQYYATHADPKTVDEARRLIEQLGATPHQRKVRALKLLLPGGVPEHLQRKTAKKRNRDFDVNDIFSVLTHLSMQPGYMLDYVYHYDGSWGYPIVYSRQRESVPEDSLPPGAVERFPDQVTSDGTTEAFLELALFWIMGGQFYLFWHANYNDRRIVCYSTDIDELLRGSGPAGALPEEVATQARDLDLEPRVIMSEDSATVRLVVFTSWGGVLSQEFVFSLTTPHNLIDFQSTCLIEYNCGVRF